MGLPIHGDAAFRSEGSVLRLSLVAIACLLRFPAQAWAQSGPTVDRPRVGNDPGGIRDSALDQIHRGNVVRLQPAWTYHTGELRGRTSKTIECTPTTRATRRSGRRGVC